MTLFINTLSDKKIFLALLNKKGKKVGTYHTKKLLLCLDRFFSAYGGSIVGGKKNRFSALKGIIAVNGPGSFTKLRTCLTILNVLSCFLNIKSVGIKAGPCFNNQDLIKRGLKLIRQKRIAPLKPFYGQAPNVNGFV